MKTNVEKLRSDIRRETRKSILQIVAALTLAFGAGVALANYVDTQAKALQVIIIPAPSGNRT